MICILLLAGALTGCYEPDQSLYDKVATKQNVELAKRVVTLLQARKFDELDPLLAPSLQHEDMRAALEHLADTMPAGEPTESEIIGVKAQEGDTPLAELTMEYHFPSTWARVSVTLYTADPTPLVIGAYVTPEAESVGSANRFTFDGKPWREYVFLLIALAGPVIVLLGFVQWLRTPDVKFRWVWLPLLLLAVGRMTVNWTNGGVTSTLLWVSAVSPGVTVIGHSGPILISASFPLGAAVFLILRKRLSGDAPKPRAKSRPPSERIEPT